MFTKKPGSDTPESVLQTISEISASMAGRYISRSKKDEDARRHKGKEIRDQMRKETGLNVGTPLDRKLHSPTASRKAGRERAMDKLVGKAKVPVSEEPLNEMSEKSVRAYRDKARDQIEDGGDRKTIEKRRRGINMARDKIHNLKGTKVPVSEEPEQIDELSQDKLKNYIRRAKDDQCDRRFAAKKQLYKGNRDAARPHMDKVYKRTRGIAKANTKITEEPEQIDELSQTTLKSYVRKADGDRTSRQMMQPSREKEEEQRKTFGDNDPVVKLNKKSRRDIRNRTAGMANAAKRLTEDLTRTTRGKYFRKDMTGLNLDPKAKMIQRFTNNNNENFQLYKDSNQVFHLVDSKRQILNTWHTDNKEVRQEVFNRYGLDVVTEDEQLDEGSRIGRSSSPADYLLDDDKTDRAKARTPEQHKRRHDELKSKADSFTHPDLKSTADKIAGAYKQYHNLSEGVEDSNKREVGTDSLLKTYLDDTPGQEDGAKKKPVNEEPEQIDELSVGLRQRYITKATRQVHNNESKARMDDEDGSSAYSNNRPQEANRYWDRADRRRDKNEKRLKGILKAKRTLTNEESLALKVKKAEARKSLAEDSEQLDEMSFLKRRAYKKAAEKDVRKQAEKEKTFADAERHAAKVGLSKMAEKLGSKREEAAQKKNNRLKGMQKA